MITPLVLSLSLLAQTNDPAAVAKLNALPDAFSKLDSFQMEVTLRASLEGMDSVVTTKVLAKRPNLYSIEQTMHSPAENGTRRFVCDGKALALPEPKNPGKMILDPAPHSQWEGSLRAISSVMYDNGWPLGVVFRPKKETQDFVRNLVNVLSLGKVEMEDGSEAERIVADAPAAVGDIGFQVEVFIGADGFMRRMSLKSKTPQDVGPVDNASWVLVWDVKVTKDPKIPEGAFKLPPVRGRG